MEVENTSESPAPRRRIVATPQRTQPAIALVMRDGPERAALEQHLRRTRPVMAFPSLAHFCTGHTRRDEWAGVLVARTDVWDARLERYVYDRRQLALLDQSEELHGWPDDVPRLTGQEQVDGWLVDLDAPRVPLKKLKTIVRTKRTTTTNAGAGAKDNSPQRAFVWPEALRLSADSPRPSEGSERRRMSTRPPPSTALAQGVAAAPEQTRAQASESKPRKVVPSARPPAPHLGSRAEPRAPHLRSRAEPRASTLTGAREQKALRAAAMQALEAEITASGATVSERASSRPASDGETRLIQLAAEIGLLRAAELLALVRERAQRARV